GFEVTEERGGFRFQSQPGALSGKPIPLLRVVIRTGGFDGIRPGPDFGGGSRRAVGVQPCGDLCVVGAGREQWLYLRAFHTFEAEEQVIHRAIEMVFSGGPVQGGAAFIGHAGQQGVTANANARTARRFLGKVFCCVHGSSYSVEGCGWSVKSQRLRGARRGVAGSKRTPTDVSDSLTRT